MAARLTVGTTYAASPLARERKKCEIKALAKLTKALLLSGQTFLSSLPRIPGRGANK